LSAHRLPEGEQPEPGVAAVVASRRNHLTGSSGTISRFQSRSLDESCGISEAVMAVRRRVYFRRENHACNCVDHVARRTNLKDEVPEVALASDTIALFACPATSPSCPPAASRLALP
jgi:hypothetical protein